MIRAILAAALALAGVAGPAWPSDAGRVEAVLADWQQADLPFTAGEWIELGPCIGHTYDLPTGGGGTVWSCLGADDDVDVSHIVGDFAMQSYSTCRASLTAYRGEDPRHLAWYRDRFIGTMCYGRGRP